MDMTHRALWTLIHGMGFGALFLLGCSTILIELWHLCSGDAPPSRPGFDTFLKWYLLFLALLAWLSVLSGAYIVYPWYRASPPVGAGDLALYPQLLLRSSPATAGWHSLGMEWKEHVAWLAPISITMVAAVFFQYGRELRLHRYLRGAVIVFTAVAFVSAGVAGFFGAMLNKYAPINGGPVIHLSHSEER